MKTSHEKYQNVVTEYICMTFYRILGGLYKIEKMSNANKEVSKVSLIRLDFDYWQISYKKNCCLTKFSGVAEVIKRVGMVQNFDLKAQWLRSNQMFEKT